MSVNRYHHTIIRNGIYTSYVYPLSRKQVFCEVAYKAETRQDIVDGIDEYIDELTVLPPSIWDPTTRLAPPEQTMTMVSEATEAADSGLQ